MSQTSHHRRKLMREGKLDPTVSRQTWQRKPQTQRVPNKLAESRRSHCRNWRGNGGSQYTYIIIRKVA
jgi:hypothetical protein